MPKDKSIDNIIITHNENRYGVKSLLKNISSSDTSEKATHIKNTAVLITLSFFLVIFAGTLLLCLPISRFDGRTDILASAFTATSSVCVTGLTVVDTGTTYTLFGQLVIIALIQIGGLGYMTLAVAMAVLMGKKIGISSAIHVMESSGETKLGGMANLAKNIVIYTVAIEAIGGIILAIRFSLDPNIGFGLKAIYFGFWHSVSAFCNAGFDILGNLYGPFNSVAHYKGDAWVCCTIAGLIIFGSMGYPIFSDFIKPTRGRKRTTHTIISLWTTLFLIVGGTGLFLLFEYNNPATLGQHPFWTKVLISYFESVICRTAGFTSIGISNAHLTSLGLMCFLMYVGACPVSTGGGIKTTTLAIIYAAMRSVVTGKEDVEICNRRIPQHYVNRAITVSIFSLVAVIIITVILTFTEHNASTNNIVQYQYEVFSAIGTVGSSTGITPSLSAFGKTFIMLGMFIGRIGSITLLNILVFSDKKILRRLPEDDVVIG